MILWSSDVFFFGIHRNLMFLGHSDVSGMYGFWSIHRKCHHLRPFRCIVTLVSVGDTSGLRFQCPSRCTEVQIYLNNTSGWANIGHFRCIAKNCQNKIHRNSRFSSNPDVFQLISRDSTRFSSKCIPAQADFNKNIHRNSVISPNPDVSQLISREYTYISSQHIPARINLTLISREYTCFPSQSTPAQTGLT